MIDLKSLIEFLGTEGARAGLEKSELTVADLLELTPNLKIPNATKLKRAELISAMVSRVRQESTKSPEELMLMDAEALRSYFQESRLSRAEIIAILAALDVRPGSVARKNLTEFAAQEISDIGMYARVSKGGGQPR